MRHESIFSEKFSNIVFVHNPAGFCIEGNMRWATRFAVELLTVSILCLLAYGGTPGSFRGTVVEGEKGAPQEGWLYVRGMNGGIRRVDISKASVSYDEDVPADQRKPSAREQLTVGAEVRVTAEQGSDGEWRASRIEIIKTAPARTARAHQPAGPVLTLSSHN